MPTAVIFFPPNTYESKQLLCACVQGFGQLCGLGAISLLLQKRKLRSEQPANLMRVTLCSVAEAAFESSQLGWLYRVQGHSGRFCFDDKESDTQGG